MRKYIFILLFSSLALAQQQEAIPTPKTKGGGIGTGIIIDLGVIFNAIKNAIKKQDFPSYPPLEKKAEHISISGNTYTIDWVVYYANNTNATQTGVVVQDGPISTIIPGSLQQPSGWTGSLSASNTIAQWIGNAPPINGYMSSTFPASYSSTLNITGSGDGYRAIPYRHISSGGKLRIYFINHHNTPIINIFKCIDTTTGNYCPGFPKGLPKGDGSTNLSSSGMYDEEYYIDPAGKLYYPVTAQDKEYGLGCYDLENDTQCGFYRLGTSTTNYSFVKGPWKVGNELYMVDGNGKLYCLNATNPSNFCSGLTQYFTGYTFPAGSFPDPSSGIAGWSWGPAIFGEVVGTKLYFITDLSPTTHAKNIRAFCFDSSSKSQCSSGTWGQTQSANMSTSCPYPRVWSSFIYYDNTLNPKHICTRLNGMSSQYCFDLITGNPSNPTVVFGSQNIECAMGAEVKLGNRTYFADFFSNCTPLSSCPNNQPGRVLCWDWSTGAPCAPTWEYKSWPHLPPKGNPREYTVNVDDKGCIWVVGDNAPAMWFFDPNKPPDKNGYAQKCGGGEGKYSTNFQPWQYCSGPKPFIWLQLQVANANISDFTQLVVSVKDSANNTLLSYDCVANNNLVIDLSPIQNQTNGQPLNVEVSYALASGSSVQPEIRAYYHASPLEFCYKSQHKCPQQEIKNAVAVNVPETPKLETVIELPTDKCTVAGEGGQQGSSGQPSSGSSGQSSSGGSGSELSGGIVGGVVGGVVGGLAGGTVGGSGTNSGELGTTQGNNGLVVLEKDGKVKIMPEVKQKCYWRPKQKTQESKPEIQLQKKKITKHVVKKLPEGKPEKIQNSPDKKPKKLIVKKHTIKKVNNPQEEMEYICEPEK